MTNGFNSYGIAKFVDVNDHGDRSRPVTTGVETFLFGASETSNIVKFPFASNVNDAPTEMLNSDIPGTYLFSLNNSDGGMYHTLLFKAKHVIRLLIAVILLLTMYFILCGLLFDIHP